MSTCSVQSTIVILTDLTDVQGTGNRAMDKLTTGGYFVTIAGSLATKVKPGVKQSQFINSDTNLYNIAEMDALTAIAESGPCVLRRLITAQVGYSVMSVFFSSFTVVDRGLAHASDFRDLWT